MAISAKSRSRHVLIEEASADESLNDNNPGMHPGHELSDLHNVQRQPAGEQVIHYARAAQISSFPDHPEAAPASSVTPPPMDAAVEKQEDEKKPVQRRLTVTCICSLIFHATLAAALFFVIPKPSDEALLEAGEAISVVMLGSSDADESAAGETDVTIQEEVVPEAVEPDTLQPVEVAKVQPQSVQPETIQPTDAKPLETVQPAQEITRQSADTIAAVEPEILVSETPAETSVAQPMSTMVPEQAVETPVAPQPPVTPETPIAAAASPITSAIKSEPEEVTPVETAEISPEPEPPVEVVRPLPKPKLEKPVEKKQVERSKPTKEAKGSDGEARQEARRGVSDGQANATSDNNSRTSGGRDGAGGASAANYMGKVQSRLSRCADRLSSRYRSEAVLLKVRVAVTADGSVTSARALKGSGLGEIDSAILDKLNSCNLPALPDGWGASHTFDFALQVTPR